jgi:hypothetical protein
MTASQIIPEVFEDQVNIMLCTGHNRRGLTHTQPSSADSSTTRPAFAGVEGDDHYAAG